MASAELSIAGATRPAAEGGADRDAAPNADGRALDLARSLYALRGCREAELGVDLFGEPAWDMLLDLFISAGEHRRLSVSALCIGSRCAAATALRYLGLLECHGLVQRAPDATDARRSFVAMTPAGLRRMEQLLLCTLQGHAESTATSGRRNVPAPAAAIGAGAERGRTR